MGLDHAKLPVSDIGRSRDFYCRALAPFGWRVVFDGASGVGFGTGEEGPDEEPISITQVEAPILGVHLAFSASSSDEVNRFWQAAVSAGGTDHGAPGMRPYGRHYYAAFVFDPDGHNLEAVFHGAGTD